jgi:hypothetical protein
MQNYSSKIYIFTFIIRGLERTRKFFFVLKSLVPTQSSQDREKLSCPFQSTDNFPEWKLAFSLPRPRRLHSHRRLEWTRDNSRTYYTGGISTPILRSGISLFSAKYHVADVGTRNSCYLRTYFLLVPHDLTNTISNTVI